ncbi:aldo/keto reductase [Sediminicoccus sp. KRV36]|uniref:aldo/keto reductase n=1 Tax=Sediminicoccus sp. KRV36 TaxID=3133721 RepID=UPI00200CF4BF|nr:aldo/keto reductase [Sediminicoccus rosea]UPY36786.1 aldo/keto reductase [Sediminicoccus rosea]
MSTPLLTTARMTMPALGLGTWPLKGQDCEEAVESALGLGYRHIDTAEMYGNEAAVGAGLATSGIPRGDIFLTTKIWHDKPEGPAFRAAFTASLERLKQPYVDLLLVHWPSPALNLPSVLTALAEIHAAGLARAVGVSNFPSALLRQALALDIAPIACLQVEQHAMLGQQTLLDITQPAGIVMTSYTPLGKGEVLEHPVLTGIAARLGATPAQVALAYLLSKNLVAAVPKARSAARQAENLAATRLVLSATDLAALPALPKNRRFVNPEFAPAWDPPSA